MNPLLTLALGMLLAAAPPRSESVREPNSKVVFPVHLTALASEGAQHELLGTGIKTKTIFKIDVYALGLYADPGPAAEAFVPWKGQSARRLAKKYDFYKRLIRSPFGKTLRIVMVRDVKSRDWLNDLEDRVLPMIETYERREGFRGGEEAWKRFRSFFDMKKLRDGNELVFTSYPGEGRLIVSLRGELRGEVYSRALCWSFFEAFLGKDPVSDSARRTMVKRAPVVIKRELEAREAEEAREVSEGDEQDED